MTKFIHFIMLIVMWQIKLSQFPAASYFSFAALYHDLWVPLTFFPFNFFAITFYTALYFFLNISFYWHENVCFYVWLHYLLFFSHMFTSRGFFVPCPDTAQRPKSSLWANSILSHRGALPVGFIQNRHHKIGVKFVSLCKQLNFL